MDGLTSRQQRAWQRFLLRNPMEALERRVMLSVSHADCFLPIDVISPSPATDTLPVLTDPQASSATPVDSSGNASGNITDPANQTDTYSFQASAGQNYSVQINAATLEDGLITIVDQDGVSQLDYAEAIGAGTSDSVAWQAPADGTYYLQVTSGDGQSTGTYSVSVAQTPADTTQTPPDGTSNAAAIPVDSSGNASGNITDPANQTDTYSFQATAGQNYMVQINTGTLQDGCVTIVDQDGVTQYDWTEAFGANASASVSWQAPADGTYFLQVISGDAQSTGTYSVSVAQTPADTTQTPPDNGSIAAAIPLDSSGTASGNITDPTNQIDTYSFQATAGQYYTVQINTTTLQDGGVSIVDQDGVTQLDWAEAFGTGASDSIVWQASADGIYYLQVMSGDGQSTGTYSVSVAQAPADTIQTPTGDTSNAPAIPLDSTGTANGNITDPSQTDTYSFQAIAGQNYSVQITTTTLADGCLSILDQDGMSPLDWTESVGAGVSPAVVWQAPADGTYYLQVISPDGQSTGAYSVSVTPTTDSPTTTDDQVDGWSGFGPIFNVDQFGNMFGSVNLDGSEIRIFAFNGRIMATAGDPIALAAPAPRFFSAHAAGGVSKSAAPSDSGGSVPQASTVPVPADSGVVTVSTEAKAAPDFFASQNAPIGNADLLHKPDNLLGSDGSVL